MYAHRHSFVEPTILKFSVGFWYLIDKTFESYCIIVWKFSIVKIRKKNNRIRISEVGTVSNSVDEKKQIKLRSILDCRSNSTILFCCFLICLSIRTKKNSIMEINQVKKSFIQFFL